MSMHTHVALLCVGLLAASGCQFSGLPDVTSPSSLLERELSSGRTPGVQYRFFSADSVLYRWDGGWADVAGRVPVSGVTTYNAFSVTKTVTALAVLQLVEADMVDLDRPAADYLPDFPYPPEITVRELLTHSAGIPNPIPLRWTHLAAEHPAFDRDAFFAERFAENPAVDAAPGEQFAYSNLGYQLLGQLIERVSGQRYEEYVTDRVLAPLGTSPAELGFSVESPAHATGYHRRWSFSYLALGFLMDTDRYIGPSEEGWMPFRPYYLNGPSYGGLVATADGLGRYAQALLGPSFLSEESKRSLFTEHLLADDTPSGVGMAWFKGEIDGHTYFAHAGGGGGYYTEVRLYPELGRGSVIVFNRSGMSDRRMLDRVDRPLLPSSDESTRLKAARADFSEGKWPRHYSSDASPTSSRNSRGLRIGIPM